MPLVRLHPPCPPFPLFRACVLLVAALVGLAGCEEESEAPAVVPTPTVSAVSATTVAPGDTIEVSGDKFAPVLSENTVRFNNAVGTAVPFAGSTTRLRVVVPANAATGPVSVALEGAAAAGVGPDVEVTRGVGDVWVFDPIGIGDALRLPSPTAAVEYLIVPHATNPARPYNEVFSYTVASGELGSVIPLATTRVAETGLGRRESFEALRHQMGDALVETAGVPPAMSGASRSRAAAAAATREFNVLASTSGTTFTRVTAELKYTSAHCLVYADVDTLATGNLRYTDFKNFGDTFDNSIRPVNTTFFGTESDVDNNGRVIILVTPVVNRFTDPEDTTSSGYIGGFFLANDLYPPGTVPASTTNHAEIFYVLAAEPNGEYSGLDFPVLRVAQENISTIAHEYEHLISFSYRLFQQGGATQITWLEEGMAHMAENLLGMNESNVDRANLYLDDPGAATLEHQQAPLKQRGGIYLFLRWLGDRYGEGIYKQILQSKCSGRACIEAVTGEGFYLTVADFLATLYLSGRGINNSDRYNYQSIDLSGYRSIPVQTPVVGVGPVSGDVLRTGGDFYLFTNATTEASEFVFAASNARLRAVVVRTK